MKQFITALLINLVIGTNLFAQVGGNNSYEFLNLSPSARSSAMGGSLITIHDGDLSLAYLNPAILNEQMNNRITFHHIFFPAKLNYSQITYSHHFKKLQTTFAFGLQNMAYGKFSWTNEDREDLGAFAADDIAVYVSAGRKYDDKYSYGATLKSIESVFEFHNSFGIAADIAGMYHDSAAQFTASLVVKNIGTQIKPYTKGNLEPLPFEIQLGISKKLAKAPFRISFVAHTLQQLDIRYNDPNEPDEINQLTDTSTTPKEKKYVFDKVMRHFIIGTEIIFGKNFNVGLGYNHQRRMELAVPTRRGLSGFSFGFNLRIRKFYFAYSHGVYLQAFSSNNLTLSLRLNDFLK